MVTAVQSDDEVEAHNLISSLSKLFEKNKLVKYLEKTLTSVLNHLEKIVSSIGTTIDIQQWAAILTKAFDNEFTTHTDVDMVQA